MLVVLIIIHYTVYPIFKLRPGGKGFIAVPGSNDETLYWNNINSITTIPDTALGTQTENWSMMLDVQVDNPTANTQFPRVLFARGPIPISQPTEWTDNDTILNMNPSFNMIMYLDRLTNDLYISVQTLSTDGNSSSMLESAFIPNIPVGKSVRVGVMVGSKAIEVYINGYLAKTKTFATTLAPSFGAFQAPNSTIMSSTARVMNLRIWRRPLSPGEFRAYGSGALFTPYTLPDSCLSTTNTISTEIQNGQTYLSNLGNYMNNVVMSTGKAISAGETAFQQGYSSSIAAQQAKTN